MLYKITNEPTILSKDIEQRGKGSGGYIYN